MVSFKRRDKKKIDGTQIWVWRRRCKVPEDLREAFELMDNVDNLETVAGQYVVESQYQPLLLQGAHMYNCDVKNFEEQLSLDHGGWSEAEAWGKACNQVIANAATGLNDMESSLLFAWLPEDHKKNARNSLLHRWIGWDGVETKNDRLVPTRRRISYCFHKDVVHYSRWRE